MRKRSGSTFEDELQQLRRRAQALEAENDRLRQALEDESTSRRAVTNARLAAIVSTSPDAIMSFSLEGVIQSWNAAAETLFGYAAEEAIGAGADLLVPAACPEGPNGVFDWAVAGQELRIETTRLHKNGTPIDVSISAAPMRTEGGRIVGVSAIMRDIRERKRAQQSQSALINELNHRVKNSLATIQSIAMQTLRAEPDATVAHEAFQGRLIALAKAHDLLTEQQWQHVSLRDLLQKEVASGEDDATARIDLTGVEVRLRPNSAVMLGMAFHELAANAAKYGALSVPEGRIEIDWGIDLTNTDGQFYLTWAERNGPPVSPSQYRGFGRRLIERGIPHEFGGCTRLEFNPAGLLCRIEAPSAGMMH